MITESKPEILRTSRQSRILVDFAWMGGVKKLA